MLPSILYRQRCQNISSAGMKIFGKISQKYSWSSTTKLTKQMNYPLILKNIYLLNYNFTCRKRYFRPKKNLEKKNNYAKLVPTHYYSVNSPILSIAFPSTVYPQIQWLKHYVMYNQGLIPIHFVICHPPPSPLTRPLVTRQFTQNLSNTQIPLTPPPHTHTLHP